MKTVAFFVCIIAFVAAWLSWKSQTLVDYQPLPTSPQWWGKGQARASTDTTIRSFDIKVSAGVLQDLKTRLTNVRYFDYIDEENRWARGTHPVFMQELVSYWLNEYDWAKQEKVLNQFHHFKTNIDGLDIHFIHEKGVKTSASGKIRRVIPLILIHGWPGSFYEFYGSIPRFINPSDDSDIVFDVVVPSLPGYGFSDPAQKPGFTAAAITRILSQLMARLGYDKYIAQGGDYGGYFTKLLAVYDKEHCAGIHLNFYPVQTPTWAYLQLLVASFLPDAVFNAHDQHKLLPVWDRIKDLIRETGYMHIQATKPYTVALALSDSPLGLAAYIIEKFNVWSDHGGNIYNVYTKDQLITNVMLYWVPNRIASSMNYYYEIIGDRKHGQLFGSEVITVPTALADFKGEILGANPPRAWAEVYFRNIKQYSQIEKGGHFAAMEQPEIFSADVFKFAKLVNFTY